MHTYIPTYISDILLPDRYSTSEKKKIEWEGRGIPILGKRVRVEKKGWEMERRLRGWGKGVLQRHSAYGLLVLQAVFKDEQAAVDYGPPRSGHQGLKDLEMAG